MSLSESDTRAKLIDPALHSSGWTEDLIRREKTAGAIEIVEGRPRKQSRGRIDYTLRIRVNPNTQPIALALIEAKAEHLPPMHGLYSPVLSAGGFEGCFSKPKALLSNLARNDNNAFYC